MRLLIQNWHGAYCIAKTYDSPFQATTSDFKKNIAHDLLWVAFVELMRYFSGANMSQTYTTRLPPNHI